MICIRSLIAFGILLGLEGCAALGHGPRTAVTMQTPAVSNEATQIRRVAVLPFDGMQGREFATEIQGLLAGVRLNDAPYFNVADRSMNERVFAEIKLSQSGAVSRDQALRLGRLLGVKGLYTGTAGSVASNQSFYQEARSKCNDINAKLFSMCKNPINTTVSCTRLNVSYSFSPKLIDVETGQVIYARSIAESASAQSCPDDTVPSLTTADLAGKAKQLAFNDFLRDIAPSYQTVDIQLLDSLVGLDGDAYNKLPQGISFAVAGRLDRACELWGEVSNNAQRSPALSYDLGICAEANGDTNKALQLYTQADRLLDHPDDQVSLALVRIKHSKRNATKFAAQTQ